MFRFSAKTERFSESTIEFYVKDKQGVVNAMLLLQTHPDIISFKIEEFGIPITDLYDRFGLGVVSKFETQKI